MLGIGRNGIILNLCMLILSRHLEQRLISNNRVFIGLIRGYSFDRLVTLAGIIRECGFRH